jgi:hypothetical protein
VMTNMLQRAESHEDAGAVRLAAKPSLRPVLASLPPPASAYLPPPRWIRKNRTTSALN